MNKRDKSGEGRRKEGSCLWGFKKAPKIRTRTEKNVFLLVLILRNLIFYNSVC